MTGTSINWEEHARALAEHLANKGVLGDPAWRAAVESVPRHKFVPRFFTQQSDGTWSETSADSETWLDSVYADIPLVTALASTQRGSRVTMSSSTKPALMLRMLAALDIRNGHKVLEIGTGTGYNAALLSHRLGDTHVFSVDIVAELVDSARRRLAELGYQPTLATTHGAHGLPEYSPFDRIIATCSVPKVPQTWADQLNGGGRIVVDIKRGTHAGNLALLEKFPDRLEGRFLPGWAGFMAMRDDHDVTATSARVQIQPEAGIHSKSRYDPRPWKAPVQWLLASARIPQRLTFGYRGRTEDGGPKWATFTSDEGPWCAVALNADADGSREVRQSGPTHIWTQFETIADEWQSLGCPDWDRLGLTITPDGRHEIWLDSPKSNDHWTI